MKVKIFFDGGIRPHPNGGFAYCYGWVLKCGGKKIGEGRDIEVLEENTGSCFAEFGALSRALRDAAERLSDADQFDIYGDSRAVIDICSGVGTARRSRVVERKEEIYNLTKQLGEVRFLWIPRKKNGEADMLGRVAFAADTAKGVRIELMNKVNTQARRQFGRFYDSDVMAAWCESITGKHRLAKMSVEDLRRMLKQASRLSALIRSQLASCNTVTRAVPVH